MVMVYPVLIPLTFSKGFFLLQILNSSIELDKLIEMFSDQNVFFAHINVAVMLNVLK